MSWEIRILVYIENPRLATPATCMEWERNWAQSLDDVLHLLNAFEPTGGLYTRLVINLEQWQWTYQFGWERVDYLWAALGRAVGCTRSETLMAGLRPWPAVMSILCEFADTCTAAFVRHLWPLLLQSLLFSSRELCQSNSQPALAILLRISLCWWDYVEKIPLVENKKKPFWRVESDSAKSAKFSIVRKLCQPGVYVLVSVVASLYVSGRGSTQQKSQLSRSTSKALAKTQKNKSNKAKAKRQKSKSKKAKAKKF